MARVFTYVATAIEIMYHRLMATTSETSYMQVMERQDIDLHCYEMLEDDEWLLHDTASDWHPWMYDEFNV